MGFTNESNVLKMVSKILEDITRNRTTAPSTLPPTISETSLELKSKKVQPDIDCISAYKFYYTLRQGNIVNWCDCHLTIDENDNAIKIAEKFH